MSRNAETHEYSLLIHEQMIVVLNIKKIKSFKKSADDLKNLYLYEERITRLSERAKMLLKSTSVEWSKL